MDKLDGMRTFVASVEAGSFTAAADRLGVSNKLVSKYVAELESRLGVRLLHRTTRRLGLTDAGRRYYGRCVEILEQVDDLESSLTEEAGTAQGRLRVAAPTTFGELHVAGMLRAFQKAHPRLTVDLRLNDRFVDLAEEGFDLAIRIGRLGDSNLVARKLATTALWAFAAPDYLDRAGRPEAPCDLRGHACLHDANLRSGTAWPFTVDGQSRNVAIEAGFMANSAQAIAALALEGEGIGLGPDYVVAPFVASGKLERVLPGYASLRLDIHAVFLEGRMMPAKVRLLLDDLVARFRRLEEWTAPSS